MAAGLFYVYTEPGSVDEAEFHDWYDHEHGPARLTVPGFRGARRLQFGFGIRTTHSDRHRARHVADRLRRAEPAHDVY